MIAIKPERHLNISEIRPGFVIPASDSLPIVEIPIDLSTNIDALQKKLREEFELHIKFHSLLDEPLYYNSKQDHVWKGLTKQTQQNTFSTSS